MGEKSTKEISLYEQFGLRRKALLFSTKEISLFEQFELRRKALLFFFWEL
jgi:hypothetical protein